MTLEKKSEHRKKMDQQHLHPKGGKIKSRQDIVLYWTPHARTHITAKAKERKKLTAGRPRIAISKPVPTNQPTKNLKWNPSINELPSSFSTVVHSDVVLENVFASIIRKGFERENNTLG